MFSIEKIKTNDNKYSMNCSVTLYNYCTERYTQPDSLQQSNRLQDKPEPRYRDVASTSRVTTAHDTTKPSLVLNVVLQRQS